MVKRVVSLFVVALACSGAAWGETTFRIAPPLVTGSPGDTVMPVVQVATTEDIAGLQFTIEYDSTVVTLLDVLLGPTMPVGFAITNVNTNLPSGPFSPDTNANFLVQISGNGINQWFTGEQDVAILVFLMVGDLCSTSPLNFDTSTCQRTHLATIELLPICNALCESGVISTIPCPGGGTDAPIFPGGKQLRLMQNVPNPFNPSTTFRFELPVESAVLLQVFDVTGRVVRVLLDAPVTAGLHEATWDGRDESGRMMPSGAYYYQLATPYAKETRRALMLK